MNKKILAVSLASVAAIATSFAFVIGSKGIHLEAVKADPETATVTFDKDHHATGFKGGYDDRERADYNAQSSNGGYSVAWLQHVWTPSGECEHNTAPLNAFYSFTSKGVSDYFFLRLEIAGLTNVSWNISYTGLDESNKGSLSIGGRGNAWDYQSAIHSSGLFNNGENTVDCSISAPYHLELIINSIPEGATVTINSFTATYSIADCKTNRGIA